ncbi:hypothetical protein V6N00_13770 [Tersicoccus sp. MR15.9]|uniref:hypothetical protein n=1 Tax=Tersicoccus mangrovi TaxID=3121635 RepID=UPI002FE61364
MTRTIARHAAGTPESMGGKFAAVEKADADVTLTPPPLPRPRCRARLRSSRS